MTARYRASTIDLYPSGSMITRVFLAPDPTIYASIHESLTCRRREKEMIQPHPLSKGH
jgi:hypothetical protein